MLRKKFHNILGKNTISFAGGRFSSFARRLEHRRRAISCNEDSIGIELAHAFASVTRHWG
jgi:hypothetical protein